MEHPDTQPTNIGDITEAQNPPPSVQPLFGFWRRIIAFGIDSVVLGLVGSCLGLFFVDYFVSIGGWGRLLGFVVAGVYFSIMNSDVSNGQTIGKHVMKIKVVDVEGNYLKIHNSTIRYMIFGSPYFLNGANVPGPLLLAPIGYIIGIIVFGGIGSIIYLYIFNRPTRQSLHDLAVGSFVVKREHSGSIKSDPMWKGHLAIVGALLVVTLLFLSIGLPLIGKQTPFAELLEIKNYIDNSRKFNAMNVMAGHATHNGQKSTYLRINVVTYEKKKDYKQESLDIAAMIKNKYPDILGRDTLYVSVSYGYDIGIASYWNTYNAQYSRNDIKMLQHPPI